MQGAGHTRPFLLQRNPVRYARRNVHAGPGNECGFTYFGWSRLPPSMTARTGPSAPPF